MIPTGMLMQSQPVQHHRHQRPIPWPNVAVVRLVSPHDVGVVGGQNCAIVGDLREKNGNALPSQVCHGPGQSGEEVWSDWEGLGLARRAIDRGHF
jgi:hypothetical protein